MNTLSEKLHTDPAGSAADPGAAASTVAPLSRNPARRFWLALIALAAVIAAGAYFYSVRNAPTPAPAPAGTVEAPSASAPAKPLKPLSDEQLERMVAQAAAETQKEPANASAWALLAHSYEMLGKFAESVKAYKTLAQLRPNDAQVLADYADVLAVANGRSFKGDPADVLKRALAADPKNAKALVLAGSAAVEEQDYALAIAHLEKARAVSTDPGFLAQIDASLAQARVLAGGGAASAPTSAPAAAEAKANAPATTAGVGAQVSGRVWLADDLRAKVPAQAALFVFARPADGSRMPVALLRRKASDLPLDFTLDDTMAMVPDAALSKQSAVVVVARISLHGNVTPAPGDFEGVSAPVAVGTKNLKLEITEVLK